MDILRIRISIVFIMVVWFFRPVAHANTLPESGPALLRLFKKQHRLRSMGKMGPTLRAIHATSYNAYFDF